MQLTLKESRSLWDWRAPRWRENPAADLWLDSWTSGHEPLCPLKGEAQALLARTEAWIINCSYWRSKRIRQQRNSKRGGDWYRAFSGLTSRTNLLGKKIIGLCRTSLQLNSRRGAFILYKHKPKFLRVLKITCLTYSFQLDTRFSLYIYIFWKAPKPFQITAGGR